jgi:hypothetical protein
MTAHQATATGASAPRRLLWITFIAAALLGGWTAIASVRGHSSVPLHALAEGEQRLASGEQRLVQDEHRLAHELKVELAKEYQAIRPADTDQKPPPIPPSETWPAQ